ncbi:hypothetical protein P7K49_004392 [Saguinus oedipus]|uniref:Uncharacterized protein n=1 Tax=Saguinus oedipus TaxID=9490 RepID=A0ABQ9W798_SAGOE|nr:hypothetical protein P7K49_004392 [Saguinus oedipus]
MRNLCPDPRALPRAKSREYGRRQKPCACDGSKSDVAPGQGSAVQNGGKGDLLPAVVPVRRGCAEPAPGRQVFRGADFADRGEDHTHWPGNGRWVQNSSSGRASGGWWRWARRPPAALILRSRLRRSW